MKDLMSLGEVAKDVAPIVCDLIPSIVEIAKNNNDMKVKSQEIQNKTRIAFEQIHEKGANVKTLIDVLSYKIDEALSNTSMSSNDKMRALKICTEAMVAAVSSL